MERSKQDTEYLKRFMAAMMLFLILIAVQTFSLELYGHFLSSELDTEHTMST